MKIGKISPGSRWLRLWSFWRIRAQLVRFRGRHGLYESRGESWSRFGWIIPALFCLSFTFLDSPSAGLVAISQPI
jgi:hypothetical protein